MKIIKNNYQYNKVEFMKRLTEPHRIICPNCTSELEYTMADVTTERTPNGKSFINCEACGGYIAIPKS